MNLQKKLDVINYRVFLNDIILNFAEYSEYFVSNFYFISE